MKEIILSRTDRIGDVVLTTSTFAPLRQRFPEAKIRILVEPSLVPLLSESDGIQPVACDPGKGAKGIHLQRVKQWREYFRKTPADCILFLHPDNDLQIAAFLAGIPIRIGYRKQIGRFSLTDTIPYRRHLGEKHEAACNFDLLERIGCPLPSNLQPVLSVSSEQPPPSPYAIFHPAAFGNKPRWPAKHYANLAKSISQEFGWKIILIGSESSPKTFEAIRAAGVAAENLEDRGGKDSLLKTAELLKKAEIVISRDSGPAHLAAAMGAPLVCLMGQCDPIHSPTRWAPLGLQVRTLVSDLPPLKGESRDNRWERCFEAIQPDEVLRNIREMRNL